MQASKRHRAHGEQAADFGLSGALVEDLKTGNVKGVRLGQDGRAEKVVSKYPVPADSCEPKGDWRVFVFQGDDVVATLYLHRQSHFIVGRDPELADITVEHESCSEEHAAIQYRQRRAGGKTRLYLMDLESVNGTYLNKERIDAARYVEVKDGDLVKFGHSSRDFVFKKPT